MAHMRERVEKEASGMDSNDLIEVVSRQPCTKIQFLVDAGIAMHQTASSCLQTLAGLGGFLRPGKHRREMCCINDALFADLVT